jgi:hypothetical protein
LGEEEDPMNVNPNRKYELDGKVDPSAIPPRTIIPIVKDSVNNFQAGTPNPYIPPSPPIKRGPKRTKYGASVGDDEKINSAENLNSAGSYCERR